MPVLQHRHPRGMELRDVLYNYHKFINLRLGDYQGTRGGYTEKALQIDRESN